jgi:hypothetical protein
MCGYHPRTLNTPIWEEAMNAVHAVVGYLPDAIAKALASGQHKEPLQVRLEQGNDYIHAKVNHTDVTGVLLGASQNGETSVQIFVTDAAKVDLVFRGTALDIAARPISDFGFGRLRPPINVIFIHPESIKNLVALDKNVGDKQS